MAVINNITKIKRGQHQSITAAQAAAIPQTTEEMRTVQRQFIAASGKVFARGSAKRISRYETEKTYGPKTRDEPRDLDRSWSRIYNVTLCDPASGVTRLAVLDIDNHAKDKLEYMSQDGKNAVKLDHIVKELRDKEGLSPFVIVSGGGHGYQILLRWNDPQPIPEVAAMLASVTRGFTVEWYPKDNPTAEYGKSIDIPGQRNSRLRGDETWKASAPLRSQWKRTVEQRSSIADSYDSKGAQPDLVIECLKRIPRPDDRDERFSIVAAAYRSGGQSEEVVQAVIDWWDPHTHLGNDPRALREFNRRIRNIDTDKPGATLGTLIVKAREADPTFLPPRKAPAAPALALVPLGEISVADLYAEPIVKRLFYAGRTAMIYGPSGGGKTLFAVGLACAVASGTAILGRGTVKSNVAYFALEAPHSVIKRMLVWCDRYPRQAAEVKRHLHVCQSSLRLADTQRKATLQVKAAIELIKQTGSRLAIFDTFARTMPGLDENTAMDSGVVMEALADIVRETGVCAVIIHHTGKDLDVGFRGSNAIGAAAEDHVYVVDGTYSDGGRDRVAHIVRLTHAKDDEASEVGCFRVEKAFFSGAPSSFSDEEYSPVMVPMDEKPENWKEREKGAVTSKAAADRGKTKAPSPETGQGKVYEMLKMYGEKGIHLHALYAQMNCKDIGDKKRIFNALHKMEGKELVEKVEGAEHVWRVSQALPAL